MVIVDIEGKNLSNSNKEILAANEYIVAALNDGADIVIWGRCTDASPIQVSLN